MRVLLHAINGVGLGHIVRLAWIARAIGTSGRAKVCAMVTTSKHAAEYFDGPTAVVPCDLRFPIAHATAVLEEVRRFRPDVMVFDSRWPQPVARHLAAQDVRSVLILRAMAPDRMLSTARQAADQFGAVLLPHTHDELEFSYRGRDALLRLLLTERFGFVGPLARVGPAQPGEPCVIFSLGAGGEYLGSVKPQDSVCAQLALAVDVGRLLAAKGIRDLRLLVGPMLGDPADLGPLTPMRSAQPHQLLGTSSCMVSRGGYNTSWEAIGAGSHLVLFTSHNIVEDVETRCRYLDARGLARYASAVAEDIAAAVLAGHARDVSAGRRAVNRGLAAVVRAIAG